MFYRFLGRLFFYFKVLPYLVRILRPTTDVIVEGIVRFTDEKLSALPEDHPARKNWEARQPSKQ